MESNLINLTDPLFQNESNLDDFKRVRELEDNTSIVLDTWNLRDDLWAIKIYFNIGDDINQNRVLQLSHYTNENYVLYLVKDPYRDSYNNWMDCSRAEFISIILMNDKFKPFREWFLWNQI